MIVKCGSPELTARLRALGRRSATPLPPVLRTADVMLDPGRRVAFRNGRPTAVKTTIRRLRAKLGEEHAHLIQTVRSVGYRFGQVAWHPGLAQRNGAPGAGGGAAGGGAA